MIEIKYNTRVFIDPKTNHIKIRVRWNKNETTFSLEYRADPEKWDGKAQRTDAWDYSQVRRSKLQCADYLCRY